jgi:hypothetical protein
MKRSLPTVEEAVRILRTTHTRRAPKAPPPVKKQVQPLLKSLEEKFAAADDGSTKLRARWPEIAGEQMARISEPVRIIKMRSTAAAPKAGTLEVRVSGSFAPLVQHQAPTLIDRVNLYLGGRLVDRLRIVQGPLTETRRPAPKPRPRPLNASEEVRLRDMVSDVADDRLRNDLLKLGRAIMMRNAQGSGHK